MDNKFVRVSCCSFYPIPCVPIDAAKIAEKMQGGDAHNQSMVILAQILEMKTHFSCELLIFCPY